MLFAKAGYRKIAILHDNSAYSKGLADEVKKFIEDKKMGDIVFFDALVPGERDYSAILTKIMGRPPDVLSSAPTIPKRACCCAR